MKQPLEILLLKTFPLKILVEVYIAFHVYGVKKSIIGQTDLGRRISQHKHSIRTGLESSIYRLVRVVFKQITGAKLRPYIDVLVKLTN